MGRRHGPGSRADEPVEPEIDLASISGNDSLLPMVVCPVFVNAVLMVVIPVCSMIRPQETWTLPQATWNDRLDRPNW
jgi:hypothetical protein